MCRSWSTLGNRSGLRSCPGWKRLPTKPIFPWSWWRSNCAAGLGAIHRVRSTHKQIVPYLRLTKLIDFFSEWPIVPWNEPAADTFDRMRRLRVRIGTQDLKIAAIALANDATLLSANLRDFDKVPGLRVENWLSD